MDKGELVDGAATTRAACLLSVLDAAGDPVGLGLLVAGNLVVTCAHVVDTALGGRPIDAAPPSEPITLSWPLLEISGETSAQVVTWRAVGSGDLAVLEVTTELPVLARPGRLAPKIPGRDALLSVFGFPVRRERGQWAEVRASGFVAGGYLQVNSRDATTPDVRRGYSGSPVHDMTTGEIVGIVAEAASRGGSHDSLVIPATEFLPLVGEPSSGSRSVSPMVTYQDHARPGPPFPELNVLHLSDLRLGRASLFGGNGSASADGDHDALFSRLHDDLAKLAATYGLRVDVVVVTGDLTQGGLRSEFDEAVTFLSELASVLDLPRHRFAIVPGNHDINRKASEQYFLGEEADEREPQKPYWPKWRHYATAFERFYGPTGWPTDVPRPHFTADRPWTMFEISDLRVAIAGLNSTMAESHLPNDHYGSVGRDQLAWFGQHLRRHRDNGWLVLGAVHHNAVRRALADDENLTDADDLDRSLGQSAASYPAEGPGLLHLLLHGHTHDGQLNRLPSGLLALSTGSAAVPRTARAREIPNQYQVLTIQSHQVTRHCRVYLDEQRRWTGDNRADLVRDAWRHVEPAVLPAPAALHGEASDGHDVAESVRPRGAAPSRSGLSESAGPVDPFLNDVADVTRLREEGAELTLNPSITPGRSYLVLTKRDESGVVDRWPVGAVRGAVTGAVLDEFIMSVHVPLRSTDPALRSRLVYGGEPPPRDVRQTAVIQGVQLFSLREYRQVIDPQRVRHEQAHLLQNDTRYPADLYVDQRFRQEYPASERDDSGRPALEDDVLSRIAQWLSEDGARFVTVLGDFGRGKTFLLRQLVRELPSRVGGVEPLLVELRTLDKGPDLYDVVGQHLRRLDVGNVTNDRVRHLIDHGGVALLLDGFDELVQRVTYPTAAAYLGTLLEGATGQAKIVVTSRSQHFSDDSQIRAALLETSSGRDASRIIALEDFTDDQIREFLYRHYVGDVARAQHRYQRLDDIKDLLGLSRNPRMLAFIADLPDERLDQAALSSGGTIGAAELYREILDHWLDGEVRRQRYAHGRAVLPGTERLAACRALSRRLWANPAGDKDTVGAEELIETAKTLEQLERLQFTADEAAHTIGSGSLLTRSGDGFGFVHRSIMEWLVADNAATAVKVGDEAPELAVQEMSDLMTDFFCDLAGHATAVAWADSAPIDSAGAKTRRANATRVRARLLRRSQVSDDPSPIDDIPETPLDLSGQDLRDQDVAALGVLPGTKAGQPGTGLRRANLKGSVWKGTRIRNLDLTEADLTSADLRQTRIDQVDLSRSRLREARLTEARLSQVRLQDADLRGADLTRARLNDVDLTGVRLDGGIWTGAAVLGGKVPPHILASASWEDVAVTGRDPSAAVIAAGGPVISLAFDSALNLLAAAHARAVELIDTISRQPVRVINSQSGLVRAVIFANVGGRSVLAVGTSDGHVRLWDPSTGRQVQGSSLAPYDSPVSCLAFGAVGDDMAFAVGSEDGTVQLWALTTKRPLGERFTGHEGPVTSIAFGEAPNAPVMATGGYDGSVQLWDPVAGGSLAEAKNEHGTPVRSMMFGQVGKQTMLTTADAGGTVSFWDSWSGTRQGTTVSDRLQDEAEGSRATAFGELGGRIVLAIGSRKGTVELWDAATGESVAGPMGGKASPIRAVTIAQAGTRTILATGDSNGTVRMWDPTTAIPLGEPRSPIGWMSAVAFGHVDGRATIATGSNDGAVQRWDPLTGTPFGEALRHGKCVNSVAFGEVGRRTLLATAASDGTLQIWDPALGTPIDEPLVAHTNRVCAVAFGQVGGRSVLATGSGDQTIRLWDPLNGTSLRDPLTGHTGSVNAVAFTKLGNGRTVLASASDDKTAKIWDAASGTPRHTLAGHTEAVHTVAFGRIGKRILLATGSEDGSILLWDASTGALFGEPLTGHLGPIQTAAFGFVDGHPLLTSGSGDGTVLFWDPATGTLLGDPNHGHAGPVTGLTIWEDKGRSLLATIGGDGTVRLTHLTMRESERTATRFETHPTIPANPVNVTRRLLRTKQPPPQLRVPDLEAHAVGTLLRSDHGWAVLLPDGSTYKSHGDVSRSLWWAIKMSRFEVGELDDYDPGITRMAHAEPLP
jgi:WD40 repeat protein/uncharacterized protein YjbI with pentapeptide repeats/3',5'-cyclic AMP phosphodiesterase CpdA